MTSTSGSTLSFKNLSYVVKTSRRWHFFERQSWRTPRNYGTIRSRKPMLDGGSVFLNDERLTAKTMHKVSSVVEQEGALLGVLTVRGSIAYALRLHLPLLPRKQVNERVERVIHAVGLQGCADQRIGTPISRGLSGGQKRRVTAACAVITFPRILFLDEVTSGLDSTSAREVVSSIRDLAKAEGIIVIATIHQPSLETISQFTNIAFLAAGKLCYFGGVNELDGFFEKWGKPVGRFTNPTDHAMNFLNSDFSSSSDAGGEIKEFRQFYLDHWAGSALDSSTTRYHPRLKEEEESPEGTAGPLQKLLWNTLVLAERTALNYARNLLAYGVRAGMYGGMGFMLAVIWVHLGTADSTINDRLSVHFYSVAFLSFMSVAGIPSFLEERCVYLRESKNGLYTTLPYILANTLVNLPFLFACTVIFTLICYWAIGLHHGPEAFFRFVAFLFLSLSIAGTQALIVSSLLPIFVAALAITAA